MTGATDIRRGIQVVPTVSFKLTESARRTIARHCADRGHGPSVPEIIWKQKIEGTAVGEWGIGYHPADLWDSCEPESGS